MSNLLYHKELTDAQCSRIKILFEKPQKVGRPALGASRGDYRHVATRYDKLALCFKNFVLLAASLIHF